uniref:Uncharacterized protein n=1 Tax=viral metagenome TaxID=1070528 RepID=A0A6M3X4L9_9ZZZZ
MIKNLTPHRITISNKDQSIMLTLPSEDNPARCLEITKDHGEFDGFPLVTKSFGKVENLPDPEPDVLYIVSKMIRDACPDRNDIASPGDLFRDENGEVMWAGSLVVNP